MRKTFTVSALAVLMAFGGAAPALAAYGDQPLTEESSTFDCRYDGNRECGPNALLPDGTRVGPSGYGLDVERYNAVQRRKTANTGVYHAPLPSTAPTPQAQPSSGSSGDTGGMWRSLDAAIASGDQAAIDEAITNKGPSPALHDQVVEEVREAHPELADRYGF